MRLSLFFTAFLCTSVLAAQLPVNPAFTVLADSLDIRINQPFGAGYQLRDSPENDYLADDLTVVSRQEKLELRFKILPETENDVYYQRPHVRAAMLLMNLGSNDDDAVTAVLSFDDEELAVLNADWARLYTFRPKRSFSEQPNAQLVASYKAGRGMIYTILLFGKSPENLEGRQLMLRFR